MYPNLKDKVLYTRLKEDYGETNVKLATFYRYTTKLRFELGLEKKNIRKFMLVEHKNPGEEMQVDMGEKMMTDMYGGKVKVYFVVFILSFSRMRFCQIFNKPITTAMFIESHEKAFKYFDGRTKMLIYDQAKIAFFDETAGSIIFVKEFEDYVKSVGYAVYLCKKRDPSTKGMVENTVRVIKMNFLEGRTFNGINALNSACLTWLDNVANATLNRHTLKAPNELYAEECKSLIKVKPYNAVNSKISVVSENNSILYKKSLYSVPIGKYVKGDKVVVEEMAGEIHIFDAESNELICSHDLAKVPGAIVSSHEITRSNKDVEFITALLGNDERLLKFIEGVKAMKPRYLNDQCRLLKRITDYYRLDEVFDAIEHCNKHNKFCITELIVYLVMMYGIERCSKIINYRTKYNYIDRAKNLYNELYGGQNG